MLTKTRLSSCCVVSVELVSVLSFFSNFGSRTGALRSHPANQNIVKNEVPLAASGILGGGFGSSCE